MDVKIPSEKEISAYYKIGEVNNPGNWISHSRNVGIAAAAIAKHHPDLNSTLAYGFGCLHDIGRIEGPTDLHHLVKGYDFMMAEGFTEIARICITHSFPIKNVDAFAGKQDCSSAEVHFLKEYLESIEYNEYDYLIQLCDALSLPTGFCVVEKRFVDVTLRYGFNDYTIRKWKAVLDLVKYFEEKIGKSIYSVLPKEGFVL